MKQVTQDLVTLPRCIAKDVLKHLERAGHERRGKWHKVYPTPSTWDIVQDEAGCTHGYWLLPNGVEEHEGDADERVQVTECTCGYNDTVTVLQEIVR